ncbi:MAG: outer membrane protein assembly factor BamD [Longimicrobiales bacterium]
MAILLLAGCASSGPNLSTMDADTLLDRGLERIAEEEWDEAIRALEQFIFQYPTHDRYQEARFRLGDAYAGKDDRLIAASEYGRLADDFPNGQWADDARFRVCQMYYELSPIPPRDQEYTMTAIDHCSSLMAFYPDSEFAPRAAEIITQLQNKLAEKELQHGDFYFKAGAYDSAIIVYQHLLENYPTSAAAAMTLLRLYQSYTEIGYEDEATQARERLLKEFPDSEAARQLRGSQLAAWL